MFQDRADMPGMGTDLDRSKQKLEEQEIINQELQKNHNLLLHSDCFTVCSLNSLRFYSTQFKMDQARQNTEWACQKGEEGVDTLQAANPPSSVSNGP